MTGNNVFYGIYDFSYAPFALGDAITWQINVLIGACENQLDNIVHCLGFDQGNTYFYGQQYITSKNCQEFFENIYPAFLCSPKLFDIRIITYKTDLYSLYLVNHRYVFPDLKSHIFGNLNYYSHKRINNFFYKEGYIPRVSSPKGYQDSMDSFIKEYCRNRIIVAINVRQRKFFVNAFLETSDEVFYRDSNLSAWYSFFKTVELEYPEILFLIMGGISEWERELFTFSNVIILRTMGYNLAHELTMFHKSDFFMGTSSGFSAVATFSTIPYIITNYDYKAAAYAEIGLGSEKFPFALNNQFISWGVETRDSLMKSFLKLHSTLKKGHL